MLTNGDDNKVGEYKAWFGNVLMHGLAAGKQVLLSIKKEQLIRCELNIFRIQSSQICTQ